jgi:hypothetical protein
MSYYEFALFILKNPKLSEQDVTIRQDNGEFFMGDIAFTDIEDDDVLESGHMYIKPIGVEFSDE